MALWDKLGSRGNVEDRRGLSPGGIGGGLGIVGVLLVLGFNLLSGQNIDPSTLQQILGQLQQSSVSQQQGPQPEEFQGADSYEVFASTVIGSNNDVWREALADSPTPYSDPKLVLFRDATNSACGFATSQIGPHYCPLDRTIYLDETFFDELQSRYGAEGGDVAEAYVLAHEVGHHVQNITGIMDEVNAQRSNEQSVRLELQADCFAGVWAYSVSHLGIFAEGEINEAVDAAAAVGDDRIQQANGQSITPENWTHGSSEQRVEWFNRGFTTGKMSVCNPF